MPAGLVRERGADLDCIVLHELAHIRRADAWLHLCERVIAAFLYVNPAVTLLLRSISLERESACDDWAVERSHGIDLYTRTLASFAVWGVDARAVAACGTSGFGRATLARINRLEDARRNGATTLSRFALGGCLIVLALFALTFQSLAPAVAVEAPQRGATVVALVGCKDSQVRYIDGPAPANPGVRGLRTVIKLQVSATGLVTHFNVYQSSGNNAFDDAAVHSALHGRYAPATHACRPAAGTYMFMAQTEPK